MTLPEKTWNEKVSDAVYDMLCAAFKVNPDLDSSLSRFVPAYVEDVTTPQAHRPKNVCYYYFSVTQGTEYDYIEVSHKRNTKGELVATVKKNIPVTLLLCFYGPDADADSEYFWSAFLHDSGYNSPRAVLRRQDIVPSGKPKRPLFIEQTEGTYNRRRCDVSMNLLYKMKYEEVVEAIMSAPEIVPYIEYST